MVDVVIGEFMDAAAETIASMREGSVLINTARINTARNVSRVLEENA
ncbi:MAG: hypothetical protein HRU39_02330 [Salinicola sp.]|nr:hypothetical protein [Salinicola sp.]NRB54808.1 hypothetical protein [Salinicola sp.]